MGTSAAVGGTGSRWNNITTADQGLHELLMMFAALLVVLISSHHLLLLPHTAAAAATTDYMNQGCGTSGAVLAAAAATVAINTLNFSTSNLTCIDKMWPSGSPDNHFLLWSQHDNITNVVSIVVAMPSASPGRWAALGFSKDSYMIGSTAVVARLTTNSPTATATEYFLKDKIPNQVFPDRTGLSFVMAPKSHYDAQNKILYMAFQVNFMKSVVSPNYLLYAYGPLASDGSLQIHDSHYAFPSPFVAGVSGNTPLVASRPQLANAHGAIQVIGWGVLLPIGALLARYCRAWDPIWFYLHVTFQIIGFMFVIAGIGTGLVLSRRVRPSRFYTHRGLGITVFFLACLQVLALVFRPKKDAKVRRFWNWYHESIGRIVLILAVGNIFLGMHMADAQHSLRVGYAVILTLELLATLVLEFMLWLQWKKLSTWDAFAPETKSDLFTFASGA